MNKLRWLVTVIVLLPAVAAAQNTAIEERLPANTSFYVLWRGAAAVEGVRGSNPLLRMWDDPEFVPVRDAWLDELFREASKDALAPFRKQEFLFGASRRMVAGTTELVPAKPGSPSRATYFVVYDAAGIANAVELFLGRRSKPGAEDATLSSYDFRGRTVWKQTVRDGIRYFAVAGDLLILSNQKELAEDLLERFASAAPPSSALAQTPDFQVMRRSVDAGAALEIYFRMPDLTTLKPATPAKPGSPDPMEFVRALHLDRLRVVTAAITFLPETTRFRVAVLGDTAPGGIFDLVGAGSPTFETVALVTPEIGNYTVGRVNFNALYRLFRSVLAVTPQQAANIDALEAMVAAQIGLGVPELMLAFSGEVAAISPAVDTEPGDQLMAVAIEKQDVVLLALRKTLENLTTSEDQEGETTLLSLAFPYTDPRTGAQRRRFYYVAVTPRMVLAGPRKAEIRQAIARLANPARARTLAGDPRFAGFLGRLPADLSGFGYADLKGVPWEKFGSLMTEAENQARAKPDGQATTAKPMPRIPPAVFARYLRTLSTGVWKNSAGVHYDVFVE